MPPFKTLRLIGKRHRIQWAGPGLKSDDGDLVDGLFDASKKLIQIAGGQTHDDERETLLHEILHALEVQMNAHIPEDKLRQLAVGLYATLKDNRKLVQYLLEEEEEDADVEVGTGPDADTGAGDVDGGGDHGGMVRSA
jgi:hypothetical protein